MQAPEYANRLRIIADLEGPRRGSRWSRHGMRDINDIIIGYIGQIALSFCRCGMGFAILWRDIQSGRNYIAYPSGVREQVPASRPEIRVELMRSGDVIYTMAVRHNFNEAPAGAGYTVMWTPQLQICNPQKTLIRVPPDAVTARIERIIGDFTGHQPVRIRWLTSDGAIRTESILPAIHSQCSN